MGNKKNGFSLLEVLISVSILTFITIILYKSTVQTYRLRDTLGSDLDFYTSIATTLNIMHRDIQSIYSPSAFDPTKENLVDPKNASQKPLTKNRNDNLTNSALQEQLNFGAVTDFWLNAISSTGIRPSRFQGEGQKISFIANSHVRIYKDSLESDFSKIIYQVIEDKNPEIPGTKMLIKKENTAAFAEDNWKEIPFRTYTILKNIQKFEFTYYQKDSKILKNFKTWDSNRSDFKSLPPDFIELDLVVTGPRNQLFEAKIKFKPEFPFYGVPSQF